MKTDKGRQWWWRVQYWFCPTKSDHPGNGDSIATLYYFQQPNNPFSIFPLISFNIFSTIFSLFSVSDLGSTIPTSNRNHISHGYMVEPMYLAHRHIYGFSHAQTFWVFLWQTWDLSKILHHSFYTPKLLHRHFHLISTVFVIKTQKMSENGEIYTSGKKFTFTPVVTGQISPLFFGLTIFCIW